MNALEALRAVHENRCRNWSTRHPDRRALGYICTYAPEEIMHAAGFTPIRLMESPDPITEGEAVLPSFCCALARSCTDQLLKRKFDFLAGVIFPQTCDTMQCLADIWRMTQTEIAILHFALPTAIESPHALDYTVAELHHFAAELGSRFDAPVTTERLYESIALYNETRDLLTRLYASRDRLSAADVLAIVNAGMLMPKEDYNPLLRQVVEAQQTEPPCPADGKPRLILSGAILDDLALVALVENAGAHVVGDDLCSGSRYFDTPVAIGSDPYVELARRYLNRAPCPSKHAPGRDRGERLIGLIQQNRADGVIFFIPKYCDPHAFDYPRLKSVLERAGVPHLCLETEHTVASGQVRTRVEAFVEMIGFD
ncbi:MAG: 2-hydroxyacyl-CoA dehydratase [Chloroflexi bacterium]|nr:2-hydroxyacyl-CoA dehydratase [Chloroflexota bacterium]